MEPFIIKRVRSSEGHEKRVVHWVERTRRSWLGSHIDWSAYTTLTFLEEWYLGVLIWLFRPLFLFIIWIGRCSWWHRFALALSLLLPLCLLIPTARKRSTDDAIMLARFSRCNTQLNASNANNLASKTPGISSWVYLNALSQLEESHRNLLLEWRAKQRWPFGTQYNAPPPKGETLWNWWHQIQLRLSWQEGTCTTIKNCQLHHVEILDNGDVGHFSGLTRWHEDTRIYLKGAQWDKLLTLSAQFPASAEPNIPQNHVLFVSYRDGNDWKLRLYDRRQLPVSLVSLSRLIRANYID